MFGGGEHRVTRDLGAGAGGRGNSGTGQTRFLEHATLADHFEVIQDVAGIGGQHGNGFGSVDGAPATEGNHTLDALFGSEMTTPGYDLNGGFTQHAQQTRFQTLGLERLDQGPNPGGRAAGHHQDPLAPGANQAGQRADCSCPKQDPVRGREIESHRLVYHGLSWG